MTRDHLDDDTRLDIALSAAIGRHRYDATPDAAIQELQALADGRNDILARVAGTWAGFYEDDPHVRTTVDALREIPGATQWIELGRERAGVEHRGRY